MVDPTPMEGSYNWDEFAAELRDLLSRYAPVIGKINEEPTEGLQPPFTVGDFVLIAHYQDVNGNDYTGHFVSDEAPQYRIKGLVQNLREIFHDV